MRCRWGQLLAVRLALLMQAPGKPRVFIVTITLEPSHLWCFLIISSAWLKASWKHSRRINFIHVLPRSYLQFSDVRQYSKTIKLRLNEIDLSSLGPSPSNWVNYIRAFIRSVSVGLWAANDWQKLFSPQTPRQVCTLTEDPSSPCGCGIVCVHK